MTGSVLSNGVESALEGRVIMLGDSHVRAFSTHAAVIPVFLGPGKQLNFLSEANAISTRRRVERAICRCPVTAQPVVSFGEAVCRYLLGRGWHLEHVGHTPARVETTLMSEARQLVDLLSSLADDHDRVIDLLLPPASLRRQQTELHRTFNDYVKHACRNTRLRALDPFVMGDWGQTGPRDWYIDAIHCGDRFAEMVTRNFWAEKAWPAIRAEADLWPAEIPGCDWLEPDSLFRCYRLREWGESLPIGVRARFGRRLRRVFRFW